MSDNRSDDFEFIDLNSPIQPRDDEDESIDAYQSPEDADAILDEAAKQHNESRHSSASRTERRRIRRRKLMIRRTIFGCAVLVFLVSLIGLITIIVNYNKADKIYSNVEQTVFIGGAAAVKEPATNSTGESNAIKESVILTNYDHAALLALNSDAVGYLQIPALNLLLPVVQGDDNEYYLTHTLTKESSKNGTLFIDSRNTESIDSQNTIIYGHCMKNGSMFGTLSKFNNEEFYLTDENKYIYFYIEDKIYQYEVYSAHTTPAVSETYTTQFASTDAFLSYIDAMLRASFYTTNAAFAADSKTITFSTCTNDDDVRFVLQAVRVDDISSSLSTQVSNN